MHRVTEQMIVEDLYDFFALEVGSIESVRTYEEVGMLSNDKGLVINTDCGAQFQITIKQSK